MSMITIVYPYDEGKLCRELTESNISFKTAESKGMRYDDNSLRIVIDLAQQLAAPLAYIIVSYLKRNENCEAILDNGEHEVVLRGYSAKEIERILDKKSLITILKKDE
ncbi:hypothetical protein [Serratia symbiotica]|uniref:hypothetical protein n=1 Tax=Serratia symbiotica TaxID=138074 RepID=UPI001CEFEB82|nr:hypothetical protein [Serratia symbiotica]